MMHAISSTLRGKIDEWIPEPNEDRTLRGHLTRVIGWRLAEARSSAKMSQTQLAVLLGVHRNTLSRWETGEQEIDAASLYIACCVLDVSPIAILKMIAMPAKSETT